MKLLVCGPRDWRQRWYVFDVLGDLYATKCGWDGDARGMSIIAGGAKGVDSIAVDWAANFEIPYSVYPAQWNLHGKAAGHIRNQLMLDEGKPDQVIAFAYNDRDALTPGTADMVRRANKAKIPTSIYRGPR